MLEKELIAADKQKLRVRGLCKGVNAYFPLKFDGAFASIVHCSLHSTQIDFKYRPQRVCDVFEEEDACGFRVKTLKGNKYLALEQEQWMEAETAPRNAKQLLFGDERGVVPHCIRENQIQGIYDHYVHRLVLMFTKLRQTYHTYLFSCLNERERFELALDPVHNDIAFLEPERGRRNFSGVEPASLKLPEIEEVKSVPSSSLTTPCKVP